MRSDVHRSVVELRALAGWYREYAERAGNPAIWSSRVATAEALIKEAAAAERAEITLKN
jgi:hypothetical protein